MSEQRFGSVLAERRPPRWQGLLVALASVALCTALIYPLKRVAPAVSLGVVYLAGVFVVSTFWGLGLGILTSLFSAAAFNFFHLPPTGRFTISDSRNWVALAAFVVVALAASTVAQLARARAREAEERREEADLAAEMARILLRGADLRPALAVAAERLASALGLPWAGIELEPDGEHRRRERFALRGDAGTIGRLVVPADLDPALRARIAERIVPALQTVLAAALERERLQAEVVETAMLRQSDVAKTAVLRAVSHDLRSPLTAIVAAGEALHSPSLDAAERDELADAVVEQGGRLSRLIEKLLDLSRLQAGTAPPHREEVELDELLRATVENLGGEDGRYRMSVGELPPIRADAAQLERAFANLLENAARHSAGRPVSVRARELQHRVVVRVVDQGPGIPPAEQQRIFEPFYRLPGADAAHAGSGLGLAIVKGLVEANGGRVWVESLPGQGSSFVVEFPVADPQEATA